MRTLFVFVVFVFGMLAAGSSASAQAVQCNTTAQSLQGATGTVHTVTCPSGCGSATAWGTDVYSDDSSICTAAIHAGVLDAATGGSVRVTILPGLPSYSPSGRNGVTTSSWNSWQRSFAVGAPPSQVGSNASTAGDPAPAQLSCGQTAQTLGGQSGTTYEVTCPAGCGGGTVWGTDIYSDDSAICAAAIHAGVSATSGGTFILTIAPGQQSYSGTRRNGIRTQNWPAWQRSFTLRRR